MRSIQVLDQKQQELQRLQVGHFWAPGSRQSWGCLPSLFTGALV
jgi:hypothetical protein